MTIPRELRERFALLPETEVEFVANGNSLRLIKSSKTKKPTRGEAIVQRLKGRSTSKMSTDQILSLTRK